MSKKLAELLSKPLKHHLKLLPRGMSSGRDSSCVCFLLLWAAVGVVRGQRILSRVYPTDSDKGLLHTLITLWLELCRGAGRQASHVLFRTATTQTCVLSRPGLSKDDDVFKLLCVEVTRCPSVSVGVIGHTRSTSIAPTARDTQITPWALSCISVPGVANLVSGFLVHPLSVSVVLDRPVQFRRLGKCRWSSVERPPRITRRGASMVMRTLS